MTCRELIALLMDYLDGVLLPEQTERFEAHVAECDACRNYLDAYREARKLVREAYRTGQPQEVPQGLVRAILDSRKKNS